MDETIEVRKEEWFDLCRELEALRGRVSNLSQFENTGLNVAEILNLMIRGISQVEVAEDYARGEMTLKIETTFRVSQVVAEMFGRLVQEIHPTHLGIARPSVYDREQIMGQWGGRK